MGDLPNIILIVMDSIRADHLSCYGHHRRTTPALDALAAEGALYEQAIAPAFWTLPSHGSLFTGLYPCEHAAVRPGHALPPDVGPTMAESLSEIGYRTMALSTTVFLSQATNLQRGFADFREAWRRVRGSRVRQVFGRLHRVMGFGDDTARAVCRSAAEQAASSSSPFFLFMLALDTHYPYFPHWGSPAGILHPVRALPMLPVYYGFARGGNWGALLRAHPHLMPLLGELYDGELWHLDRQIGWMLNELGARCNLDNTIVIATADHGEGLGEHGRASHGAAVYDTHARVPLIVRWPRHVSPGTRVGAQVQLTDIWPSIARRLGVRTPAAHWEGRRPDVFSFDELARSECPAYIETSPEDGLTGLRWQGYKYIVAPEGEELYNLGQDPGEIHNLAETRPQVLERMKAKLSELQGNLRPHRGAATYSTDKQLLAGLEAAGFL